VLVAVALVGAGAALGLGAELAVGAPQGVALAVADFVVGFALLAFGAVARLRRPASRSGVWMALSGLAWFAGTLGWPFVGLHRGFLVLLHLSYPSGRLPRSTLARVALAAAMLDSTVAPLMRDDRLTVALSVLVAVAAVRVFRGSSGIDRVAAAPALLAALTFAGILSLGAAVRLAGADADRAVLWAYALTIAGLATVLLVDLLRARWPEAVLRGLVVDLGDLRDSMTLQRRFSRALGDPTLVIGIWDGERGVYVDENGMPVEQPAAGAGRAATHIDDDGAPLALLVHDEVLAGGTELLASVAAVARTFVTNASLEQRIEERTREVAASRRRLVEAADGERRALQRTLARGPERRLRRVSTLLARADLPAGHVLRREVDAAIAELSELATGVRPPELDNGLGAALAALAERSTLEVSVAVEADRLPETVEAAAFFVCSEALANAAKHAQARSARMDATEVSARLRVTVSDDGVGGADAQGAGLRGLADRVEALGGRLTVTSPRGAGTRVIAELPCNSH
jgi:signal transduction histidine kinase